MSVDGQGTKVLARSHSVYGCQGKAPTSAGEDGRLLCIAVGIINPTRAQLRHEFSPTLFALRQDVPEAIPIAATPWE